MSNTELHIDEHFTFSASTPDEEINFSHSEFKDRVGDGFSEHGVRKNFDADGDLKSVDVIYQAMEPGPPERRNGVRITEDFLDNVAGKEYNNPPHLKDHDDQDTFAKIGDVQTAWFSDRLGKLMLMTRTPNIEGSSNHQEAIARYTHDPPSIRDGSLGFGNNYKAVRNQDGEPEMKDGKFREFSTTNFPGGYDEGGVNTAFAEAIEDEVDFEEDGMNVSQEELDRVYSKWDELVNLSEEEMEMWDEHPCSNSGVDNSENWRDNTLMLMGQGKEGWGDESVRIANQAIAFLLEKTEQSEMPGDPAEGGPGSCPSRWWVSLLNRGHNPMDEMPSGNPKFSKETITEFDDSAEGDKPDENSAAEDFAVKTETIEFQ